MTKPSLQLLIAVAKRLRAGNTTLVAEAKKLGVTPETLRAALRELLGRELRDLDAGGGGLEVSG